MRAQIIFVLLLLPLGNAEGISRSDVMAHAAKYAEHTWTSSPANMTASCSGAYTSLYLEIYGAGNTHTGLAYDWGGWDTIESFDEKISMEYGAGTHSSDGVLSCTTGQDCSGFVSRCWETSKKYATSFLADTTTPLESMDQLLPGDAINKPSAHVVLFDSMALSGKPLFYESAGGQVRKVWFNGSSSWNYLNGYTPVRYNLITDENVVLEGHPETPILIDSFPATDSRSTIGYGASKFDTYSCAPEKGELGPEVLYQLEFPSAGKFTATVACGPGVDIDLHLLSEIDANTCIDRAHEVLGPIHVDAGTYFLSADSWSNDSGVSYPGPYTVDFTFVPSGGEVNEEPSDSCSGSCGDWAPAGCGCGPDCVSSGDCCADACSVCGACPPVEEETQEDISEVEEEVVEEQEDNTTPDTPEEEVEEVRERREDIGEDREAETRDLDWSVNTSSGDENEQSTPTELIPPPATRGVGISGWAAPQEQEPVANEDSGCRQASDSNGFSLVMFLIVLAALKAREGNLSSSLMQG